MQTRFCRLFIFCVWINFQVNVLSIHCFLFIELLTWSLRMFIISERESVSCILYSRRNKWHFSYITKDNLNSIWNDKTIEFIESWHFLPRIRWHSKGKKHKIGILRKKSFIRQLENFSNIHSFRWCFCFLLIVIIFDGSIKARNYVNKCDTDPFANRIINFFLKEIELL